MHCTSKTAIALDNIKMLVFYFENRKQDIISFIRLYFAPFPSSCCTWGRQTFFPQTEKRSIKPEKKMCFANLILVSVEHIDMCVYIDIYRYVCEPPAFKKQSHKQVDWVAFLQIITRSSKCASLSWNCRCSIFWSPFETSCLQLLKKLNFQCSFLKLHAAVKEQSHHKVSGCIGAFDRSYHKHQEGSFTFTVFKPASEFGLLQSKLSYIRNLHSCIGA